MAESQIKMRNIKIILQYEGSRYQGWQRQSSTQNTIQGKLEAILFKMSGEKIEIQGSGRTDAGVHAIGQVANFHINTKMTAEEILLYMNQYLPEDIGVIAAEEVGERFHSRLLAKEKIYCYQVIDSKLPHIFHRRYAYICSENLNLEKMELAAKQLIGTHDFAAFTSAKKGKKKTVRTIKEIKITKDIDQYKFQFRGNGFLFHMVRIIMGTLLEVGAGRINPEEIKDILASGKRELAGPLAPALGLTLMEVFY